MFIEGVESHSLYGLPCANNFHEAFDGCEVTSLDELDGNLTVKMSDRRMEEDARIGFVPSA
jgi:hypothetical protein